MCSEKKAEKHDRMCNRFVDTAAGFVSSTCSCVLMRPCSCLRLASANNLSPERPHGDNAKKVKAKTNVWEFVKNPMSLFTDRPSLPRHNPIDRQFPRYPIRSLAVAAWPVAVVPAPLEYPFSHVGVVGNV